MQTPERSGRAATDHQLFDCHKHGPQESTRWTSRCQACLREERDAQRAKEEGERRLARIEGRHRALALPARFRDASLGDFACATADQRAAVAACQAFAASLPNDGPGLLLLGPPGTGKTTLAAAVCRAAIDQRDQSALLLTQREMVRALRATWQRGSQRTEEELLDEFVSADLLVLDDAGVGYGTDAELTQLLDVVDGRYSQRRPTVVSSNLNLTMLRKALGDRVFDRLREGAAVVPCDWASFRGGRR